MADSPAFCSLSALAARGCARHLGGGDGFGEGGPRRFDGAHIFLDGSGVGCAL